MRIQHNILAMNAYRNYNTNTSALAKNLEKLSSGYKINRAGDDAAGLAISEKMRAQIKGLEAAQKNVKDGTSLVKTAEGAMQEIQDMLGRMKYLATQSSNGTYQDEVDREALQDEVNQLKDEINRIADSANFNGQKLLDGSLDKSLKVAGEKDFAANLAFVKDGQMGKKEQAGVFSIDLSNTKLTNTGTVDSKPTFTIFGQTLTLTKVDKNGGSIEGEELATDIAAKWNKKTTQEFAKTTHGVTITAEAKGDKVIFTMDKAPSKAWSQAATTGKFAGTDIDQNQAEEVTVTTEIEPVDSTMTRKYAQASFNLSDVGIKDGTTLQIGDSTYTFALGAKSKYKDVDGAIDLTDIEADTLDAKIGIVAQRLSTAAANNKNFKVGTTVTTGVISITEREGGVDYKVNNLAGEDGVAKTKDATEKEWANLVKVGTVDSSNMGKALQLQIGDTSDSYNQMKVSVSDMHTKALGIDDLDISNPEAAADAIQTVMNAINSVSSTRGTLGAIQNRLDHTSNNLSVMVENITDAESTIRDTDVAEEMMAYTKNNILVQSAQAMLAQANAVPQGVLQLLQ